MNIPLLNDIAVIFGSSAVIVFVCNFFRLPSIVGFLVAGVLIGPFGLGFVRAVHDVEILAEIGVIFLLLTIGIEFSLHKLLQIKKAVLLGGSLQVVLTIVATFVASKLFSLNNGDALFMGCLVALSSTAIVLKLFQERAEVDSPQGQTALGILIFQDIAVVPMILFLPFLAKGGQQTTALWPSLLLLGAKGLGIIALVVVCTRWVVPIVLYQIAKVRSHELFLLSVVTICLGIAWLTSSLGLSLALGAFLAGLMISESEYSHRTLDSVLPLRHIFTSFFFVSVGMLLNVNLFLQRPLFILVLVVGVWLLKTVVVCLVVMILRYPLRTGIMTGLSLAQVGEFAFLLSKMGLSHGLLGNENYQIFLTVSILSMALTPFLIQASPYIATAVMQWPWPQWLLQGTNPAFAKSSEEMSGHQVIVGFGLVGRNVARAAKAAGIPYMVIEMNPDTVRQEREQGEPIFYGDATQEATLHHVSIAQAKIVVVAVNDPTATRRIIEVIRQMSPTAYLIVRTRYLREIQALLQLGANEVIPEEYETSVEIFTRVMTKYFVPRHEIEAFIAKVRADGYQMFRNSLTERAASLSDLKVQLPQIDISALQVGEHSPWIGQKFGDIGLRKQYGLSVLAIRRHQQLITNPSGETTVESGDLWFALGEPEALARVSPYLQPPQRKPELEQAESPG